MAHPDEKVALVDNQDKVIGYKRFHELSDEDCWRMVSVWVENSQERVLFQQRSKHKKLSPGTWTPAAEGTVTEDDSYYDSAVRELAEEIGLKHVELLPAGHMRAKYGFGWRYVQSYKVVCDWPLEKFTPQTEEVEQVAWIDKAQLLNELTGRVSPSRSYPHGKKYWISLFNLT